MAHPVAHNRKYQTRVQTRQTAGVLLRSWLVKHWARVDEDVAIRMKDALLNAFATEPLYVFIKLSPLVFKLAHALSLINFVLNSF